MSALMWIAGIVFVLCVFGLGLARASKRAEQAAQRLFEQQQYTERSGPDGGAS